MTGARTATLADDILGVLRVRNSAGGMTYYVANVLRSTPRDRDTHTRRPGISTATVRRELERLEKAGKVKRVQTVYQRMICWALA
ncbi:DeoR family transcriptional regulator [Aureimonas phyllosphaerae]|uniref:Putative ArsR family transcriptional regulator n=1 Tax=Aureimonas phyllosphaerae TaxID=1166078 RepID=A0A7W6BXI9_9HYPH|nr:DeoR family transcriptional regulator [Aureimonas phyllosphaerae]MBB3937914.1 putative ArsR family transcriptional regulator [Aureimonas phyllosphaerae]MBB3961913.1 putative ArsR family transcriptional regulator [Aureimonas phyllosphaerae]SFF54650.1 DeoR-like helix-turn-helix domain-containing protein [Aureimonas phyllosphaerae]